MKEPHTHPIEPTITREQAGEEVVKLAERLCPLPMSNEALWFILAEALDDAFERGYERGQKYGR